MSHRILAAFGALVDRIKINAISKETRDGRAVWIKRRRWVAAPVMFCANRFFALAGNPVQAIGNHEVWQRWEVDCFQQLHGDGFRAFADGDRAVGAEDMPGVNLAHCLDGGTLTTRMVAAAARELRRAHAWKCRAFADGWSHGDPHFGNFLYDEATDRARLIDFEVMHDRSLPADERHAEDLLAFLQDLVGHIASDQWLPMARTFLETYDRPQITALLREKLVLPRGIPRVWWMVRTTFMPRAELSRRLAELRAIL